MLVVPFEVVVMERGCEGDEEWDCEEGVEEVAADEAALLVWIARGVLKAPKMPPKNGKLL